MDLHSIAWAAAWCVFGSVCVICYTYYRLHS